MFHSKVMDKERKACVGVKAKAEGKSYKSVRNNDKDDGSVTHKDRSTFSSGPKSGQLGNWLSQETFLRNEICLRTEPLLKVINQQWFYRKPRVLLDLPVHLPDLTGILHLRTSDRSRFLRTLVWIRCK